jgi:5-methylcytosine-specific restriction endonuclease McrA
MKCRSCSNGAEFGRKFCITCLQKAKDRSAERYLKIKSKQICKLCSSEVGNSNGIYCNKCKQSKKIIWYERKDRGICVTCNKRLATKTLRCDECYNRGVKNVQSKKTERLSAGLCAYCDENRITTSLCKKHYLQFTSKNHLGSSKRYNELLEIFDNQNGICPYTGLQIILGVDSSIDHLIPKSRGGTSDLSNLQWVHIQANFMKQDMLESEFIKFICLIYQNRCS